ncbi:MAG: STAS domain-containing protein [Bacteroidales bacterium]|nr:STAS domain-containing protein [Bacteroidales bacterium]
MKTIIEEKEGKWVVSVRGELDTDTCEVFRTDIAPVMEKEHATVELDLSQLNYISSTALRLLIILQQQVMKNGGQCYVSKVSDSVLEVLTMTGLSRSFLKE